MSKVIYLDTETSGFYPGQIGQLAMIKEENNEIVAYNYYFDIDSIEDDAAKATIHTINSSRLLPRTVARFQRYTGGIKNPHKNDGGS